MALALPIWPIADMNRDGKPDIIGGNAGHPDAVFFNEKDGTTFQRVEVGDDDEDATTYGLAIADLDNDGYPDIVVARTDGPSGIFFSTEFSPRAPGTVAPAKETALGSIPSASFLVAIRPSTGVITIEQPSPGIRDWASVTPEELFASAYHTDPALVRVNAIASGKYDATVNLGKAAQKDADRLFQEALCAFFHVTAAQEASETPVLVLRAPAGKNAKIEHSETGADRTTKLDKFVRELEEWLKQPVIDETGLAGDYEVLFNWEGVTRETLAAELLQQLDISAAVERRSIVFTILEQAN
jgi:uncharacterized protein (TIGR03435 family)